MIHTHAHTHHHKEGAADCMKQWEDNCTGSSHHNHHHHHLLWYSISPSCCVRACACVCVCVCLRVSGRQTIIVLPLTPDVPPLPLERTGSDSSECRQESVNKMSKTVKQCVAFKVTATIPDTCTLSSTAFCLLLAVPEHLLDLLHCQVNYLHLQREEHRNDRSHDALKTSNVFNLARLHIMKIKISNRYSALNGCYHQINAVLFLGPAVIFCFYFDFCHTADGVNCSQLCLCWSCDSSLWLHCSCQKKRGVKKKKFPIWMTENIFFDRKTPHLSFSENWKRRVSDGAGRRAADFEQNWMRILML